jgi:RNA polymerase sigma factor for flagellar operon FliA
MSGRSATVTFSPAATAGLALKELWRRYKRDATDADRDFLLLNFAPLVELVAGSLGAKLPSHVEEGDLISWGMIGLLEAIEHFDPELGVRFNTYANPRIRGAMLDELRALDWAPRLVRTNARDIEQAESDGMIDLNRRPTETELARRLRISVATLQVRRLDLARSAINSLDAPISPDGLRASSTLLDTVVSHDFADPQDALDVEESADELKATLTDAISQLPERHQLVLALYYQENLKLREIGEVLGVSESRVSQLHRKALTGLRKAIGAPASKARLKWTH